MDKITMDENDFQLGPISISIIGENLYLGGLAAAKNLEVLKKYKITHILTIDICPLPRQVLEQNIVTKFIQLTDQPQEDILSHFDEADLFIKEGREKGAVLVHCYFGVSRSATLVIAHIMKKDQLTYYQAFDKVKGKRKIVCPNLGFVAQLKLYQAMGYKIDKNNMNYKMHKLTAAAHKVRKVKILPQEFHDLIKPDPSVEQSKPEPSVYRCKKCRRVLAAKSNLLLHQTNGVTCKETYFLEPLAWMNVLHQTDGKLMCPKCNSKLGSFSWIMGCQCPCGVQVAPAFYLTPSKVDYSNAIKNMESTF